MATNISIQTKVQTVQALFGNNTSYRIPPFQRPYTWNQDRQWEPLWDDIESLAKRHRSQTGTARPHFMGTIVMQHRATPTGQAEMRLVIDGQQRLTTLQLAVRAAADVFKTRGMNDRASRLEALTLNRREYTGGSDDNLVKIRQTNATDRTAFQAVMREQSDESGNPSNIWKCYRYFYESTEKYLGGPLLSTEIGEAAAESLEEVLSRLLVVAAIDLEEQDEPYTIFATLNDRGQSLGPADLVKNMMMQRAGVGDDESKATRVWGVFEDDPWWRQKTGENNLGRTQVDRFIDHWVSISTGKALRTPERLPADVARYLEEIDKEKTWDAVNDLNKRALVYRSIHKETLDGAEEFLKKMKALSVGAPMATMLWLYTAEVPTQQRAIITNAVESYVIRRSLAGMTTNALRDTFAELITKIANLSAELAAQTVIEHLAKATADQRWPTDHEVEHFLQNQPMKGTAAAQREIIAAIEKRLRPSGAEPIGPTDQLTVDHIMPKSWQENWPLPKGIPSGEAAGIARDRAVKYIGNLTIITRSLNSTIRNKPWNEKKKLLKDSVLFMNRKLLENAPEIWDEDTIKERSKFMAEQATKVWLGPSHFVAQTGV